MKVLVTGSTGYLGNKLTHALADAGHRVIALVRSDSSKHLLQHSNISIVKGDILDKESLFNAMRDCDQVYHTAAKVGAWSATPTDFYTVNVEGTHNVMEAAVKTGIKKLVYTSTCGVFGPSIDKPLTEKHTRPNGFGMDYDLSKKIAEEAFFEYAGKKLDAVAVCPPKIYGPGQVSHALTGNSLIARFINKGAAFVPAPGTYNVCFAFIDDIVNGHLLAMQKGKSGEKYIIGGVNLSYLDFFTRIRTLSSCKGKIFPLSSNLIKVWAALQMLRYKLTGKPPPFAPKAVDYVFNNYTFCSDKAMRELGYQITPLDEALNKTIDYIRVAFPNK